MAERGVLTAVHQAFVRHRPGLHQVRAGLRRQRPLARLHHQVEQVDEHRGLGDAAIFDAVELDEA